MKKKQKLIQKFRKRVQLQIHKPKLQLKLKLKPKPKPNAVTIQQPKHNVIPIQKPNASLRNLKVDAVQSTLEISHSISNLISNQNPTQNPNPNPNRGTISLDTRFAFLFGSESHQVQSLLQTMYKIPSSNIQCNAVNPLSIPVTATLVIIYIGADAVLPSLLTSIPPRIKCVVFSVSGVPAILEMPYIFGILSPLHTSINYNQIYDTNKTNMVCISGFGTFELLASVLAQNPHSSALDLYLQMRSVGQCYSQTQKMTSTNNETLTSSSPLL